MILVTQEGPKLLSDRFNTDEMFVSACGMTGQDFSRMLGGQRAVAR
jgi:hypothetical protein